MPTSPWNAAPRRWISCALAAAVLACALPRRSSAQPPAARPAPGDSTAPSRLALPAPGLAPPEKNFTRAALEVTGVNVGIWLFCRYIREGGTNTGFRIGIQSWKENLLNGFEWDDNQFSTNQFAHPYHGSMYFCSARANGFDYWESLPFAFAGSIMWEYFGETHHPSINDWVATSVGGMTFGEVLHRLSAKIFDQRAQGSERVWREIGGLALNPMGGINRMFTGEMTQVGPNPPGWNQDHFASAVRAGVRFTGDHTLSNSDTARAFVRLRGVYGDPTGSVVRTPFDAFSVDIQFNADDKAFVGRAQVLGVLRSWETRQSEKSRTYFATVNGYDYVDNWAYTFGGESFGASLLHRWTSGDWRLSTGLTAKWIVLGATSSDYASYTGRTYDYGPGVGGSFFGILRNGRWSLALENDVNWLRIMNGTEANHLVSENRLTASAPLRGSFNLGAEYSLYLAERHYALYPDVSARAPQLTVYLAYLP